MDEMLHRFAWVRSARRGAEMGAASERAVLVDRATIVAAEQGAAAGCFVGALRQVFATRGTDSAGGDQGFAGGENRSFSGQPEMTASGSRDAVAADVEIFDIAVDGPHFADGVLGGHGVVFRSMR